MSASMTIALGGRVSASFPAGLMEAWTFQTDVAARKSSAKVNSVNHERGFIGPERKWLAEADSGKSAV
jgi:hypothetical protein